jgi:transcriptional regulator of acetoin/glycerol metabolism
MIEHVKQHWKIIVICLLAAVIVFLLYRQGKKLYGSEPPPSNNAVGKTDVPPSEMVVEPVPTPKHEPPLTTSVNLDALFSAYRKGDISQAEAMKESALSCGTFYRKLKKYDQAHVV